MVETVETTLDFTNFISERARNFTGRQWLFSEINRWLADENAPPFFILTGEPGIGKSAVAARLVQFSQGVVRPPDGCPHLTAGFLTAFHFCIAHHAETISPTTFTRNLSRQLCSVDGFARAILKNSDLDLSNVQNIEKNYGTVIGINIENLMIGAASQVIAFVETVVEPLKEVVRNGYQPSIVILVDSLDEASQLHRGETIIDLLTGTEGLPREVRFILTTRYNSSVLRRFDSPRSPYFLLDATGEQNQEDIHQYIKDQVESSQALQVQIKSGNSSLMEFTKRTAQASGGNFLYAKWLLSTIASGEKPEYVQAPPDDLFTIYLEFLRNRIQDMRSSWRSLYRPILGTLAVAQEPLNRQQVATFSNLSLQDVHDALRDLDQFFDPSGVMQGYYSIYHQSLSDFLTDENKAIEFWINSTDAHRRISQAYLSGAKSDWASCDRYGLLYLPLHLEAAGFTSELESLLMDLSWLQAKLDATDILQLVGDFKLVQERAEFRLIKSAVLMSSSILAYHKEQLFTYLYGHLLTYRNLNPEIASVLEQIHDRPEKPILIHKMPVLDQAGGTLLYVLRDHRNWVNAVDMTPDGRWAVSVGGGFGGKEDNALRLWDLTTGELVRRINGHAHFVEAIAMTPDGRYAASAESESNVENTIKVWDLTTGQQIVSFPDTPSRRLFWSVCITADGKTIFSVDDKRGIDVWSLAKIPANFLFDGDQFAVDQHYLGEFGINSSDVVTATPDGTTILSGTPWYELQVFKRQPTQDPARPSLIWELKGHTHWISAVAITPDGKFAVTGGHRRDCTIRKWNLETGQLMQTIVDEEASMITAIAISANGKTCITASNSYVAEWDLEKGQLKKKLAGHGGGVTDVSMSADGKLACSSSYDRTVRVWDLSIASKDDIIEKHDRAVGMIAASADGRLAVTASLDGSLKVWDTENFNVLRTIDAHKLTAHAVSMTPDGDFIVSGGESDPVKKWETSTGRLVKQWQYPQTIYHECIKTNGEVILTASWEEVKLWKFTTGELLRSLAFQGRPIYAVCLTPDGKHAVLCTQDGHLLIWELTSFTIVKDLSVNNKMILTAKVSPDGKYILSGGYDNSATLWDFHSGEMLHQFRGHTEPVATLSFSPTGTYFVSGSHDQKLMIWDIQKRARICAFHADGALYGSVFSGENTILTAGESGRLHVLELVGVKANAE